MDPGLCERIDLGLVKNSFLALIFVIKYTESRESTEQEENESNMIKW
jgi:hypothetical protein